MVGFLMSYELEKREREAEASREKEQEAPGQRSPGTSGVQGVFQERESFCEGNFR